MSQECTDGRRARRHLRAILGFAAFTFAASVGLRDAVAGEGHTQAEAEWRVKYDQARADLVSGRFRQAEVSFGTLAREAPTAAERLLALEMSVLAVEYAEAAEAGRAGPAPSGASLKGDIRGSDELTLLYTSAFLYGVGAGTWFLLETQPASGLTATLPFAAITAAPVVALAAIDASKKLPRGLPHSISVGLYVGLVEGLWLVGFQHARATRVEGSDPASEVRWSPATTAAVLWGGATAGAIAGAALGSSLITTPGRVSFTASTAMWSAALVGLSAGALLPDDDRRAERAFLAAGVGMNAGLPAGLLLAGAVSPTVARVRLVDLIGIAGGLAAAGFYLSAAGTSRPDTAEGVAALGAGAGLVTGWLVTSGMPKDRPAPAAASRLALEPVLRPVAGGAVLGVGGAL